MTHPGYRTLVRRSGYNPWSGNAQFVVVSCDRGLYIERCKAWPHGHYHRHWVLNTQDPHKVGTFINPRKALGIGKVVK